MITKFKLFENSNNISEQELELISEKILKLYPRINYGGCGVFARAFHEVTNLPYMLIIDTGLPDEDPPIHVMIYLNDGRLYDGEGIRTEEEIEEYYQYDIEDELMFITDNDGEMLDNYYHELGSGLFTTDHKSSFSDIKEIIESVI